jgi:hypothetical protein
MVRNWLDLGRKMVRLRSENGQIEVGKWLDNGQILVRKRLNNG